MHWNRLLGLFIVLLFSACVQSQQAPDLTSYVNPFIGTGGHGHTFPGVSVPFGMVQLSPDTRLDGWDGCSAYHGSDSVIFGFSHTHLSGTGCSDYGDVLVMPVAGPVNLINYGYAAPFLKSGEKASPGYYRVDLGSNKTRAELTATARSGFHRYTFPQGAQGNIVVDLKHRDRVLAAGLTITGPDEIEGYRFSQAWAQKQMVFFVMKFSRPFVSYAIETGDELISDQKTFENENLKGYFTFPAGENQVLVKVGISAVSIEGARKNLESEIPDWDFDAVADRASAAWNNELSKIVIGGGTQDQRSVFYTALYHAMLQPNLYMDTDGSYRGRDLNIHRTDGFDYFTVFSLWDTYRAAHPLYTIIDRKRTADFIRTFIRQYQEGGMLPVWELSANETGCMIGYHAIPVIADAYMKGIRDYDASLALEAMKHSAEQDHLGLKFLKSKGYIPGDQEGESVSKTLEYAYDDWCIAQMARAMGKNADYETYIRRAQHYANLYDPSTGFMRAKLNETWFSPFDPAEVNFNYTEANAWQYSFYVPQDITGLMKLMGGKKAFSSKLDALFSAESRTTGRDQADITGLIGQYAHGNEPSHHMAYLYNYAGEAWKTQEIVHRICRDLYHNAPDGLSGNEDCGQMSSWFILSAMGFYPVTPASGIYAIGTPLFPSATIRLENGKTFTVKASGVNEKNYYIQSATLNGQPWTKSFLRHEDISGGGELVFIMGPRPNKAWGTAAADLPVSRITDFLMTPVPAVSRGERTFMDSTVVELSCPLQGTQIRFTTDGSEPGPASPLWSKPLTFRKQTTLRAIAYSQGKTPSYPIEATFTPIPKNRKITLNTQYAGQYAAGGNLALIDFVKGGENFRTGTWQGYEGVDLDAVIDLGMVTELHTVTAGFFQDQGSWIFMPEEVTIFVSDDGSNFTEAAVIKNDVPAESAEPQRKDFKAMMKGKKTRYVRVVAKNRGICPPWHPAAGSKAWIFADEISID